jgi:hypothetical protein
VDKLAAKYKVKPVNAKCWVFLLNLRQSAAKKLAECPTPQHGAHKTAMSAAHTLEGFDINAELDEFSRFATKAERDMLVTSKPGGSKPNGGARGRGLGGRGLGGRARGGSGGQHFRRPTGA